MNHSAKFHIYSRSCVEHGGSLYFLTRHAQSVEKRLGVRGEAAGFQGDPVQVDGAPAFPLSASNAALLRQRLPWLQPVPVGLHTSFGFGDRLGSATPGHIQAIRDSGVAPIFAQQSVRENTRTGRTPQSVLDDAIWGLFQEGWRAPWGADADHVKDPASLPAFVSAGYSFYTVDPGEYVDTATGEDSPVALKAKVTALPWDTLQSSPEALYNRYLDRTFHLQNLELSFDEPRLLRAAAKYGRALAHILLIYSRLQELMAERSFDFEISVDETEDPTSPHEHFFIANELQRLDVRWISLAPRYLGRFEKGVDFIGDLAAFEADLAQHAAVQRYFGTYKLSLHSGSDKFSLYPLFAEYTSGRVHVKTAGTSFLEALRILAQQDPAVFRKMLDFARERYPIDRATYHVSAHLDRVPEAQAITAADLPNLLDDFDARQVLHVTYGSLLDRFGASLKTCLSAHESLYTAALRRHFLRHLQPFTAKRAPGFQP